MKRKHNKPTLSVVRPDSPEVEILKTSSSHDRHEIYKDNRGEWRWRRVAPNNQIVAVSGEGYKSQKFCVQMVRRMCDGADAGLIKIKRG